MKPELNGQLNGPQQEVSMLVSLLSVIFRRKNSSLSTTFELGCSDGPFLFEAFNTSVACTSSSSCFQQMLMQTASTDC